MKDQSGFNILYVFADQMHAFAMGCMGNPDIHTPHLDQLAAEGILFRNAYTSFPVCTPYRGVLFTGRYGSQTGITGNNKPLPRDGMTLADSLNRGGIRTSYVGKWHLGGAGNIAVPPSLRGGFQEFIGYQCYNSYVDQVWFFDEEGVKREYQRHRTDVTTDIAIERLSALKEKGDAFALFVSYQNPHYPVQPSKKYADLYKNSPINRRPNAQDIDPYTKTFSPPTPNCEIDLNYMRYGGDLDEYLRLYYAMVTQLDDNVGRLLASLEELGLSHNTVVVFTSDHGDMQGSHGLKNKNVFWEESTRVPLIVRVPGGLQGVVKEELIGTVDLYPTLLDYAGVSIDEVAQQSGVALQSLLEGESFAPMTKGQVQHWENEVFSEDASWHMLRRGDWKLVLDRHSLQPTHLFNLKEDPYEMNNRVEDEEVVKRDLLQRLMHYVEKF